MKVICCISSALALPPLSITRAWRYNSDQVYDEKSMRIRPVHGLPKKLPVVNSHVKINSISPKLFVLASHTLITSQVEMAHVSRDTKTSYPVS